MSKRANKKNQRVKMVNVSGKSNKHNVIISDISKKHNLITDTIIQLQQQNEANRLGIVTINELMTVNDWTSAITKLRQFIFSLTAILIKKYPDILAEINQEMANANFRNIEDILGRFDISVGYSKEDFKNKFGSLTNMTKAVEIKQEYKEGVPEEEGTDEEVDSSLNSILNRVNELKNDSNLEFLASLAKAEEITFDKNEQTSIPIYPNNPVEPSKEESLNIEETVEIPDIIKTFDKQSKICDNCSTEMERPEGMSDYHWERKKYCSTKCSRAKSK
jgi:hypothetical protein